MSQSASIIGRLGALAVQEWAAQAFITANPSYHDEKGWDVLLQLPSTDECPVGPLDRLPPELTCMVQVKTTTGEGSSETIKLSNWRRMCTDPIPWFVFAIRLDPQERRPISAHLVHIDETWCNRVLKRLRELGPDAHDALHLHSLTVSWGPADELKELHGRELKRQLRQYVPDQYAYVARKVRWFEELGYEDTARFLTVSMQGTEPAELYDQLADLAIGERCTFPAGWRASVSDVRFGLEATLTEFGAETGEIEFRVPAQGRMRLTVESSSGARRAAVECNVFRARAAFPFLPEEFDRVRLATDDLTVILSPRFQNGGKYLSAGFRFLVPQGLMPISRLREVVDVADALVHHDRDPFAICLTHGRHTVPLDPGAAAPIDPRLREHIAALQAALKVCSSFDVPEEIEVSVNGLASQAEWATYMVAVMSKTDGEMRAPFSQVVPIGETFGVVHEAGLRLEDRILLLVIGAHGAVTECREVEGRGAAIRVREGRVAMKKFALFRQSADVHSVRRDLCDAVRKEIEAVGCRYILDPEMYRRLVSGRRAKKLPGS
jgi:hypothetical protein